MIVEDKSGAGYFLRLLLAIMFLALSFVVGMYLRDISDLNTPEKAIHTFFESVQSGQREDAYSMWVSPKDKGEQFDLLMHVSTDVLMSEGKNIKSVTCSETDYYAAEGSSTEAGTAVVTGEFSTGRGKTGFRITLKNSGLDHPVLRYIADIWRIYDVELQGS